MSYEAPCPGCMAGTHAHHRRDHGIRPGLIGGTYCGCEGDCAEQRRAEFDEVWGHLFPRVVVHLMRPDGSMPTCGPSKPGEDYTARPENANCPHCSLATRGPEEPA